MGLDYTSAPPAAGCAGGDPDGDGMTNAQEQAAGIAPARRHRQFLAEGADNAFFKTRLALPIPARRATAVVRLDGDDGASTSRNVHVPAGAKRTLSSTRSRAGAVVRDRRRAECPDRRRADDELGRAPATARTPSGLAAPSTSWFLAEGVTGRLPVVLSAAESRTTRRSTVTDPLPSASAGQPPIERTYMLPPHSRTTIAVNDAGAGAGGHRRFRRHHRHRADPRRARDVQELAGADVRRRTRSAGVTAAATTLVPRRGRDRPVLRSVHPARQPEPTGGRRRVELSAVGRRDVYARPTPSAPNSRRTICVDDEQFPAARAKRSPTSPCPARSRRSTPCRSSSSARCGSRAGGSAAFWTEAHNSPGATDDGARAGRSPMAKSAAPRRADLRADRQHLVDAGPRPPDGPARPPYRRPSLRRP